MLAKGNKTLQELSSLRNTEAGAGWEVGAEQVGAAIAAG